MIKTRGKTNRKKGTRARGFFASADELRRAGKLEQAVPLYKKAAAADPLWGAPCNDLGVVLRKLGRFDEALEAYRDAARRDPKVPSVHSNLGGALMAVNRFEEAEAAHQKAIALAPGDPQASYQLGLLYKEMERPDLARDAFDRCLETDPDNAYYQWERTFSILKLGDFETGWPAYECRFRRGKIPVRSYPQPRWDGGDLNGKTILLYPEQGFGDQIQFARFVPELASRGARVVLESGPELQRLLSSLPGIAQCIPLKQPFSEFDVHAPLLSLPLLLRTTLDTLPARVPYLTPPEHAEAPEIAAAEGLRVGFVWAGSPTHANDRRRSIPIDLFAELFDIPGITFFSLQMGKQAEQLSNRLIPENVGFLTSEIKDFADSAALISQLDLILTVDTSMAHLAGALGLRTWVLLSYSGDWRWLMEREDSPWYPSARLFRQPQAGDWTSVVATVAGALESLRDEVASRPRPVQQPPSPPQPQPAVPRPAPSASRSAATPSGFERNFIVMGMPRSGTSWVQALLDAHPAIHCRSEDRFQNLLKRTKAFLDVCNKDLESAAKVGSDAAPDLFDQEDLREVAKTIMRRAFHKGFKKPGIEHAGTRDNSLFFVDTRFFTDLLAGIRLIYVVRDPRDVAVSLWFHNRRIDPSFPASGESLNAWVAQAAQSWHDRVAYGQKLAQSLGDRFHLVRYEDLHSDPQHGAAALFDFLGVDGSGGRVAESCATAAFKRRSGGREPGQSDPQSFFRNGLPGDWRNHLDAEGEANVVEKAGPLLQPFGYA